MGKQNSKLREEIRNRGIEYIACLVFLKKRNIEKQEDAILKYGLRNRKPLFFVTEFPTKLCKKYVENGESDNVRILIVDSDILFKEKTNRTYYDSYYKSEFAKGISSNGDVESFLNLFKNKVLVNSSKEDKCYFLRRKKEHPENIPTHPYACILWDGKIPRKYIKWLVHLEIFLELGPVIDEDFMDELDYMDEQNWGDDEEYDDYYQVYDRPDEYQNNYKYVDEDSEEDEEYEPYVDTDYLDHLEGGLLDLGYLEDIIKEEE